MFNKIGPAVLVTHSDSGGLGWITAIKSANVKGIVSFEPGGFVFPEGSARIRRGAAPSRGTAVPLADFLKLTKIPIVIWGDNIPEADRARSPDTTTGAGGCEMSKLCREAINTPVAMRAPASAEGRDPR